MSDPLIHDLDNYVVMEPGEKEKFLSAEETLVWLEECLSHLEELPFDLQSQTSNQAAAKRLLDTACALQIKPGLTIEWFAIRLERTDY